jgi:hypothetical protein
MRRSRNAFPNVLTGSRIRHSDGGDRAGIGAIAIWCHRSPYYHAPAEPSMRRYSHAISGAPESVTAQLRRHGQKAGARYSVVIKNLRVIGERPRVEIIFSRPLKAPPHTNRMLVVSTA